MKLQNHKIGIVNETLNNILCLKQYNKRKYEL